MSRLMLLMPLVLVAGCAAPRAVEPLLETGERVMVEEAERLEVDGGREARWLAQSRELLEEAYERDLLERGELEAEWVMQATRGYIAAREALLRHELDLERQRDRRRENLLEAAEAVARARELLARQGEIWPEKWDVRRLWRRE